MDDLIAEFLTETNEGLAELDLALVKLEATPDDAATLSLIFRLVHTIKGTCGFLNLPRLERVAHAAESVLGRVRDRELSVNDQIITLVLRALDRIKLVMAGIAQHGSEPAGDDSEIIACLQRVAAGGTAAAPTLESPTLEAPTLDAPDPAACEEPEDEAPIDAVSPPVSAEPAIAPAASGPAAPAHAAAQQTIRVSVDVLEELMTLVGELVLTRNQLLQLSRTLGNSAFSTPLQRLSNIASDLQEGVMKTRMQPIGNAWNKLPRLIRDLAHETGKQIALDLHGQETELDRQVLELIRDPLTHMVRNSADHGLETPDKRRAAGKPEMGRITLRAYHEGGHIIIEVADDGRGLDVATIRAKVLTQRLASEAELAAMTEAQIQGFIFRAGFSTAAAVTAISGRGVGMDVVRTNIERIGGSIEMVSRAGLGTRFSIKIPLTLAIVSALIVRAGPERFAIPQIGVMELVRVAQGSRNGGDGTPSEDGRGNELAVETVNDTPVLRLRDQWLPLVSLAALLRLEPAPNEPGSDEPPRETGSTVVVASVGSGLLGIVVDEVFDTEEIVVKPVAPILRQVTMFSGNTILGDGSVIMILDPNGVARATGISLGGEDTKQVAVHRAADASNRTALLLFRAGGEGAPKVVPLSLVARLDDLPRDKIEYAAGQFVTQYRGRLMKLVALGADPRTHDRPTQPILVFVDGSRSMGLMVDAIIDVVHDALRVELRTTVPGLLGTAAVAGQAVDVLDTSYWLTQAYPDWFAGAGLSGRRTGPRLLVVEDSDFFRGMLVPTLTAAGYCVTGCASAQEALASLEGGNQVDAIVSDIDMPHMNGLEFARRVRADLTWAHLPMVALSGHDAPADAKAGRDAGFTDYIPKSDREALLQSLRRCLAEVHP